MTFPVLDEKILKITPNHEELIPNQQLYCPVCENVFRNSGNLQMHLVRHHNYFNVPTSRRLQAVPQDVQSKSSKAYFCPVENCIYNVNGRKYFMNMNYIRQHYQKVHMKKTFECNKCKKVYPTFGMKNSHEAVCGQKFECGSCKFSYTTKEALLTHIKRKNHILSINKQSFKSTVTGGKLPILRLKQKTEKNNSDLKSVNYKPPSLELESTVLENQYPNQFNINAKLNPYLYLVKVACEARDQECQTEITKKIDYTKNMPHMYNLCTSINIDKEITEEVSIQNNSIEQLKEIRSKGNHNESPSNFSQYYEDNCFDHLVNEANFCDIETQTEISLALDQLLNYSNTYTQTCDDFLQELCLADIQTQTNWSISNETMEDNNAKTNEETQYNCKNNYEKCDNGNDLNIITDELLVSTETQTSFTQCLLECGESNNMTNGISCITQHTQTDHLSLEGLFESQDGSDFISTFETSQTHS